MRSGAAAATGDGGGAARAWRPRPDARRPWRPSTEHMVCVNQSDLEVVFGPAMGRTWLWALNENCCPHTALRISLGGHGH
jgi:hypothetical protein